MEFAEEIDSFYPRCYDFSSKEEIKYFKNDFLEGKLFQLLKNHIRYFKRKRPGVMRDIKSIVENKIRNKNQFIRQNLYHNSYPFKCREYFDLGQDLDFQCSTVLTDNLMVY